MHLNPCPHCNIHTRQNIIERPDLLIERSIELVMKQSEKYPNKNNEACLRYLALAIAAYDEADDDEYIKDARLL